MTKIAIKAQKIFTADFIESNNYLIVEDNKFAGFLSKEDVKKENIPVKEYNDAFIIPGLIDTHIHGAVGHDTMDSTPEALKSIGDYLLTQGTTTWMPTTVTAPLEDIYKAIANVAECKDTLNSARILGMFIEGPYITSKHKGAHPEEHIRPLNKEEIEKMSEYNTVKSIIIAPEKEDAPKFTKWITQDLKIKVSLGHSSANYEEACACFDMGADAGVHTYCAMEQLHHRNPNLLGAIMTRNDVYAELIADGIHVSLPAMKILLQNKPKDKALLVSDAIQGTGLKDGRYMLGTLPFNVKDGIARIDSGNLAGSTTTLLKEVRRLVLELHENPIHAVNMASLNPAKRFGVDDELGSIAIGKKADFLIITPDYELKETWLDGKCVFKRSHGCIGRRVRTTCATSQDCVISPLKRVLPSHRRGMMPTCDRTRPSSHIRQRMAIRGLLAPRQWERRMMTRTAPTRSPMNPPSQRHATTVESYLTTVCYVPSSHQTVRSVH